jgi:NAD-dependent deacetylase
MTSFSSLPSEALDLLQTARLGHRLIVFLTGAGISAESGIPTFRGAEGYWTAGSVEYTPMELATHQSFRRDPRLVWSWYLYRLGVCRTAEPNPAHRALAELETAIGDRFLLVTQNVDGLHLRAGNTQDRTFQIHGNIDYMRCGAECSTRLWPLPKAVIPVPKNGLVAEETFELLRCPDCGRLARPHVLWFDEFYDEERYHWESAQLAMRHADLLVIVGSAGATNLPVRMAGLAGAFGVPVIDVNPDQDDFTSLIRTQVWIDVRTPAGVAIPAIAATIADD